MTASYDGMECITLCGKPKAYMEYTSNDASLFACDFHHKYCLNTENNILLTVESLQRSAYPRILLFVLPSECISFDIVRDVLESILNPVLELYRDFVFSISFGILVSFFLFALDSYNTMFCTPLNLNNSWIGKEPNSSFAYPVTAGGVF